MNRAIARLLSKTVPDWEQHSSLRDLVRGFSALFKDQDDDRKLLEHSLTLTSLELNSINEELRTQLAENIDVQTNLEKLVAKQRALLDASREAIFGFDPGGILKQVNKAAEDFIGVPQQQMLNNSSEDNVALLLSHLKKPDEFKKYLDRLSEDNHLTLRGLIETTNGRHYEFTSVPEYLQTTYIGRVWCWRDITEYRKTQDLLIHQAFYDTLTNLPNRTFLLKTLRHAIDVARRNGMRVALMFIDLDDFKKVNDTEGHNAGDQLLLEVARLLTGSLRTSDVVGRFGGDEFLIILEGLEHQHEILTIYQKVKSLFSLPARIFEKSYFVSCSVGVSQFPMDGDQPEELIRKADMAMYEAKSSGKNAVFFFNQGLEYYAQHRMSVENRLRDALTKNEFFLEFQPKFSIGNRKIVGAEALIRWRTSSGEILYPNSFITIAEQIGAIGQITNFVIFEVCRTLSSLSQTSLAGIYLSFNVSALDFKQINFIQQLTTALEQYQINHSQLVVELTESVFLSEESQTRTTIQQLHKLGIALSVDDFGTGYSSFGYLKDLDAKYLKIDRSFVTDVHKNTRCAAIAKSIIDIGRNLGMQVVAEGVETEDELFFLENAGCELVQGYLLSKPISLSRLVEIHQYNIAQATNAFI